MRRFFDNLGFHLVLGTLALVLLMPTPDGLSIEGHRTAALFLLMVIWWATEAVPVAVTALIPLALFPIFGIILTFFIFHEIPGKFEIIGGSIVFVSVYMIHLENKKTKY